MTTDTTEILHGGAERLALNWVNADPPPTRIARYRVAPGHSVSMHVHTGKAEHWVIVANIAKTPVMQVALECVPYIIGFLVVLALITFVPQLVLWLPDLVYGPAKP